MKNFFKNLPIVIWAIAFFVGTIAFTAIGNIPVLITFLAFMFIVLLIGSIVNL